MIRFLLLLILSLAVAVIVTVYPEQAQAVVRLEAFGWQLETRQGPLMVGLVVLLGAWWLIQGFLSFLISGPSKAWTSLKGRGQTKQWDKFADAVSRSIDQRDDSGSGFAKRGKYPGPDWLKELFEVFTTPLENLPDLANSEKPLQAALAARVANSSKELPAEDRLSLLNLWQKISPASPLAKEKYIALAIESGQWEDAHDALEEQWQKNRLRQSPLLQQQFLIVLRTLADKKPDQAIQFLRKAQQILPDDEATLLALGNAFIAQGDQDAAVNAWYRDVEKQNHPGIAQALFPLLKPDAAAVYARIQQNKPSTMNPAHQWLRASLAHASGDIEQAFTYLNKLIQAHPSCLAWETAAQWHMSDASWQDASEALQRALQLQEPGPSRAE